MEINPVFQVNVSCTLKNTHSMLLRLFAIEVMLIGAHLILKLRSMHC